MFSNTILGNFVGKVENLFPTFPVKMISWNGDFVESFAKFQWVLLIFEPHSSDFFHCFALIFFLIAQTFYLVSYFWVRLFHTFDSACFILLSPLVSYFWVRLFLTFKFACLLRFPYRNLVLLVVGQLPVKKGLTWLTNFFIFFYFFYFILFSDQVLKNCLLQQLFYRFGCLCNN